MRVCACQPLASIILAKKGVDKKQKSDQRSEQYTFMIEQTSHKHPKPATDHGKQRENRRCVSYTLRRSLSYKWKCKDGQLSGADAGQQADDYAEQGKKRIVHCNSRI